MKKGLLIGFVVLVIVAVAAIIYQNQKKTEEATNDVVFIENFRVFEEFEMKKEYDRLLEKEISGDQIILDSLGNLVNNPKQNAAELNANKTKYLTYKQAYDEKLGGFSRKYTAQVYERLNLYIKEFGKTKHYKFILGSGGEGNVMYVNEKADVTDELIRFINQKYLDN